MELGEAERHGDWADFWLPRFDQAIEDVAAANCVSSEMIREIEEARPRFRPFLDIGNASTATHYDIWSGNVMIDLDGNGPAVSGFIDIPGFFADYARELSFMMMFGVADKRFFDSYLSHHALDPSFELRVSLYNLKMHLKHIKMYPTERYYRQGARECLDRVQREA